MRRWVERREQALVRRRRPRSGADGVLKENALRREGVDVGTRVSSVAVAAQVVGAQGVKRDEQDIQFSFIGSGLEENLCNGRDNFSGRVVFP